MEDLSRMDHRHWPHFDQSHMKDYLKDHPALKLIDVLAERDAAIAERDTAMAEKKTAFAERDAALLQRDVAYADRNTAWIERDTALAALTMLRSSKDNSETTAKFMHMPIDSMPPGEGPPIPGAFGVSPGGKKQHSKKAQDGARKRKRAPKENSEPRRRGPKSSQKAEMQPQLPSDAIVMFKGEGSHEELGQTAYIEAPPFDLMPSIPIPYCSCTGSHQQCYRWGNGGWQSACCTNVLSMYPLPMSPTKRGTRVHGRKMSGGAFRKILAKLIAEGYDISMPIDLKHHWAKHGTNRYVTIK
ncbi:hypothetical protein KP509_1Z265100 [Ceratopteris richardii]|nr:hypothetical protein KP509_1Z265100 [Ceratopteris richardii]